MKKPRKKTTENDVGIMSEKYNKVIETYFSDYVMWLLGIIVMAVVCFELANSFNGESKYNYSILVCFFIMLLLSIPLLRFYFKVRKDVKGNNIETVTIKVKDICEDKEFNFRNNGGVVIGKGKYRIIDENDNIYLCSSSNKKNTFLDTCDLNFSMDVVVLKNSRLLLSMKINKFKTLRQSREQAHNIRELKKHFSHYIDE